jgi:very-short-patch-repair endonuclease
VTDVMARVLRESERTKLERDLLVRIKAAGLPEPERQYMFARPERRYRADYAWPDAMLLAEVQGGIWARDPGRHNRGSGYEKDCERDNEACLRGWRLLRFTEHMIRSGLAVEQLRRALGITDESYRPRYDEIKRRVMERIQTGGSREQKDMRLR